MRRFFAIVLLGLCTFVVAVGVGKSGYLGVLKTYVYAILYRPLTDQHILAPYHKDKVDLFTALERQQCDAVLIGDSLIDNGHWGELLTDYQVINRGVQGIVISDLINMLDQIDLISSPIVVVMIGINDIRRNIPRDELFQNYAFLVDRLTDRYEFVLVHSVLLTKIEGRGLNQRIQDFNFELKRLAERSERIVYVDLNTIFSPDGFLADRYSFDGIHLNGQGYLKWRDVISKHIGNMQARSHARD